MGVAKPLQKMLARKLVGRGAKNLDELAAAGKASDDLRFTELEQNTLKEFQSQQGAIDSLENLPSITDEVRRADIIENEMDRLAGLEPTEKNPMYRVQARTPEEYKARISEQLTDPEFSNNAQAIAAMDVDTTIHGDMAGGAAEIALRNKQWLDDSAELSAAVFKGREGEQLRKWAEGSYTRGDFGDTGPMKDFPMVMYHADIRTDPTGRILIQFTDDATQSGLHTGSLQATLDIVAPTRSAKKTLDDVTDAFGQFEDQVWDATKTEVDIRDPFIKAVKEVQNRKFLRTGDAPLPGDSFQFVEETVDEIFEEFRTFLDQTTLSPEATVALNQLDPARLKTRLRVLLQANFDSNMFPFITKRKMGLVMPDIQHWDAPNVAENLLSLGIIEDDILNTIMQLDNVNANKLLKSSMKDQGYDHIAYHNAGEDAGTLSFIFFDEDSIQKLYAPTAIDSPTLGKQAALSVMLAPLLGALSAATGDNK